MARFSSEIELSPAGTIITVDPTNSNSGKTEAATDARIYAHITAVPGGQTIDIDVEVSHDGIRFAPIGAFDTISAIGSFVFEIAREKLGTHARVKYRPSGGSWTLQSILEKKQG